MEQGLPMHTKKNKKKLIVIAGTASLLTCGLAAYLLNKGHQDVSAHQSTAHLAPTKEISTTTDLSAINAQPHEKPMMAAITTTPNQPVEQPSTIIPKTLPSASSAILDITDKLESALNNSELWAELAPELLSMLSRQPEEIVSLIQHLANKDNLDLTLMIQGTIEGELALTPALEHEMAKFLQTAPSADETAALYRLLIGFDGVGRPLHEHLVQAVGYGENNTLQKLAALNLKPGNLDQFSYEEKFLAKEALSSHIYNPSADPTTQYYAMASYASWVESEDDLDAAEQALAQQNINLHSAALANLAQQETERGKNLLIEYAQNGDQPCITRVQAVEELTHFSLNSKQAQEHAAAKSSDCWQAYATAQKIDDPLIRATKLAEIYQPQ